MTESLSFSFSVTHSQGTKPAEIGGDASVSSGTKPLVGGNGGVAGGPDEINVGNGGGPRDMHEGSHEQPPVQAREESSLPADLQPQLDSLLQQVAKNATGTISEAELKTVMAQPELNLDPLNQQRLLACRQQMDTTMVALNSLSCEALINGFAKGDQAVIKLYNNAIEAQQEMADAIRSLNGKPNITYTDAMEAVADRCDRRVAEITSAVYSVVNIPAAEDVAADIGKMPEALSGLKNELDASRLSKDVKADVMAKFDAAATALQRLGAMDTLALHNDFSAANGIEGTAFYQAAKALQTLSDALFDLQSNRRATPALQNMAEAASRHIGDLMKVGDQLSSIIKEQTAQLGNVTVGDKLAGVMTQMHGTQAVLTHFSDTLTPILSKLSSFEAQPDKSHSLEDITKLTQDLETFRSQLKPIVRDGFIKLRDGSKTLVDDTTISGLRKLLNQANDKLKDFRSYFDNRGLQLITASLQTFPQLDINPDLRKNPAFVSDFPSLAKLAEFSDTYRELEQLALDDPQTALARVKELNQKVKEAMPDIKKKAVSELSHLDMLQHTMNKMLSGEVMSDKDTRIMPYLHLMQLPVEGKPKSTLFKELAGMDLDRFKSNYNPIMNRSQNVENYHFQRLENMFANQGKETVLREQFMQGAMIRKAMSEKIPLSTIIESQLNGASPDMIDPLCDDSNLQGNPHVFGKGGVNQVYLCTYRNPQTSETQQKIFKSDYKASLGNLNVMLCLNGLSSLHNVNLNISAQKVAGLLNCGDIMPKSSVGMLNGQYGLFMDFVPGYSPRQIELDRDVKAQPEGFLDKDDIKHLERDEKDKIRPQLMQQCNQLQWNDLLIGQGDRHHDNYKISIEAGTLKATLKGIDNDLSLPDWRPGLFTVTLTPSHRQILKDYVQSNGQHFDVFLRKLRNQGALQEAEGQDTVIDSSKLTADQLELMHKLYGVQSFKVPEYMDESIYNGLMNLEQNPDPFNKALPPDLSPAAKKAANGRLKDMIQIAKQYKNDGKVLTTAEWQSRMDEIDNSDTQTIQNAMNKGATSTIQARVFCSDLFFRDLAQFF